ncbi:uncharacterized protein LOC143186877 [Calliopsis andreniformis]|uniref:uncharacterized protein LOC143186877 n=1 Tax=Calliopsis andreniformis TaxID=337506 RepID=UPI003FCDC9DB
MWKTFCLLSLTLSTFGFPRDRGTAAEPVRVDALVPRDDPSHRKETRGQTEDREELSGRGINDEQENSSELVGRWRNNGEALEPKWRDGDTVPLLPFSQFSRYSRDKIDSEDEEDDYSRQESKRRQDDGGEDALRSRDTLRISYTDYEDYESTDKRRGYREREGTPRRRNNRLFTNQHIANSKESDKEILSFAENKDPTSTRYQGTFQIHANDYEHELDDEEYLKPRPRKRRPPQNYEFALVENETSSYKEELESNSKPWSPASIKKNLSDSESKNPQFVQNAMELKSLLKMQQEEGLSLSELLQRRNLTLNDLLKGKADAINALKSKDSGEGEDYVDETSRLVSNSFTKVYAAKKPQWVTDPEPANIKNSQKKEELRISFIPVDITDPANSTKLILSSTKRAEMYSEAESTTGKSILTTLDPPRTEVTPLMSAPTTITTSLPLPVATNSMELLPSNDNAGKLPNDGEIKAESLDEDEIMEFSDFTDYKNGRSSMSPVWLMMKDQENDKSTVKDVNDNYEDRGSTLSIEHILSPTERTKLIKNVSIAFGNEEGDKILTREDYSTVSEQEYQDDAPTTYHDLEHNTQVNAPVDEHEMRQSIMREIESALDAISYGTNFTMKSHSVPSGSLPEENVNYPPKNHQTANTTEKKSYDEVISEVEPEARAEIFELFASGSAGKRLERLLKSRNMSLEELIALRQRGSSKVHLAEVSRLRVQKPSKHQPEGKSNSEATTLPSPKVAPYEFGQKYLTETVEPITSITEGYDKGISITSSESTSKSTNFVNPDESTIQMEDNSPQDIHNEEDIKERHRTVQIVDLLTTFGSLPFAKDIQRNFAGEYDIPDRKLPERNNNFGVVFVKDNVETIHTNDTSNDIHSGYVKEIVRQEPNSIDIQAVYSETSSVFDEDEKNENGQTLSKVKPSIIASGAILGVTIVVFLAIFIVCRIRQKQKYRYRNTFSRAVFQGPMLAARKLSNSSSLSTVMVNVVATSTTKRPDKHEIQEPVGNADPKSDIDNDSLDANDSWETIPDYMK